MVSSTFLAGALGLAAPACGSSPAASPATSSPTVTSTTTSPSTTVAQTTIPTVSTTTAPSTTPTTAVAAPVACPTNALSLSISNPSGTAGSTYETLNLTNDGSITCTLTGYPGVSYVTGSDGTRVGAPASQDPTTPVTVVTLTPGTSAQATLRVVDPGDYDPSTCQLVPVEGFRVYPPGQTAAAFVAASGTACSSTAINGLTIGAVQAA